MPATEVGFRATGEYWNEYLLDDGTVLKVKAVLTEVLRLDEVSDTSGQPVYALSTTNVTVVSAPDDLRKED